MLLRNMRKKYFVLFAVCLSLLLSACGGQNASTKVVLTTGFAKNEVFKIENKSCKLPEIMVYLTCMQNQYEKVYGKEIWNVSLDGVTLEDSLKETVLARLAQIKTLNLMAESKQITLDEEEKEAAKRAADAYMQTLNKKEVEYLSVNRDMLVQMYEEYALAEKTYAFIIRDINPEISDDDARIVTVMEIYFKTYTTDGTGERIEYTENAKYQAYIKAKEAYEKITQQGISFETVAAEYGDGIKEPFSFGKGGAPKTVEDAAFNMGNGEISEILEDEDGYHIIQCLSTFDREETDANKLLIMEEQKKKVFDEEYDIFVESLTRKLNEKLWADVACIHDEEVQTDSFFEIFNEYFR